MKAHPQAVDEVSVQDVLVVDNDLQTCEAVRRGLGRDDVAIRFAPDADQAALEMRRRAADLVLINVQVQDNAGLTLVEQFRRSFPKTQTIALTRHKSNELLLQAWRAGASDLLIKPLQMSAVRQSLQRAVERRQQRDQLAQRHVRLRNVCRQLNKARHEISQQVNLLCHDLVKAYQDLAEQLNSTQVTGQFAQTLGEEFDVELLLRRTLEWVLQKLGPVNAAVYLPDSEDNYSLGAYLNFDTNADSVLIEAVAQTVVPYAAEASAPVMLERDQHLQDLFGQDAGLLVGRAWLATAAYHQKECLGVIVVFRQQGEPIDPAWAATLASIGPVLADKIARTVRLYQRGHLYDEDEPAGESGEA